MHACAGQHVNRTQRGLPHGPHGFSAELHCGQLPRSQLPQQRRLGKLSGERQRGGAGELPSHNRSSCLRLLCCVRAQLPRGMTPVLRTSQTACLQPVGWARSIRCFCHALPGSSGPLQSQANACSGPGASPDCPVQVPGGMSAAYEAPLQQQQQQQEAALQQAQVPPPAASVHDSAGDSAVGGLQQGAAACPGPGPGSGDGITGTAHGILRHDYWTAGTSGGMSDLCSPLMRLAMHDLQLLSGGLQLQHLELCVGHGRSAL